VTEIGNTAIQSGTGTQDQVINFEVKIKITDPDAKLRSGMSCNARIETATKNNVIAVPLPSVTARSEMKIITTDKDADNANSQKQTAVKKTTNKPDEIVFLTDNGKAKVVKVKTGLSDDNYIEITEGLKENDDVISGSYKAISRDLHDGAIIRVDNNRGPRPAASDKK
jgi:HlyD family secretion protein